MRRSIVFGLLAVLLAAPALMAQEGSGDHVEVGAFADYFNLSHTNLTSTSSAWEDGPGST